jgi:hypothetical protein
MHVLMWNLEYTIPPPPKTPLWCNGMRVPLNLAVACGFDIGPV